MTDSLVEVFSVCFLGARMWDLSLISFLFFPAFYCCFYLELEISNCSNSRGCKNSFFFSSEICRHILEVKIGVVGCKIGGW